MSTTNSNTYFKPNVNKPLPAESQDSVTLGTVSKNCEGNKTNKNLDTSANIQKSQTVFLWMLKLKIWH